MLQKVAHLENVATRPRVDCFFWNQGNSDASGGSVMRESYQVNLVNFLGSVWKEFRAIVPTLFPFVPLQLHWGVSESKSNSRTRRQDAKVNEAMCNGCQELGPAARMATITPEMEIAIASMFLEDGHSGTGALLLEGRHLADTFADLLNLQISSIG